MKLDILKEVWMWIGFVGVVVVNVALPTNGMYCTIAIVLDFGFYMILESLNYLALQ